MSEVVADGVAQVFAPGVVFGEVEFETGGGVVGGDFAGVANEVAEEVGEGSGLGDWSELLVPLGHGGVGEWGELLEDGWDLSPVGDGGGDLNEVGGVEAALHGKGEPLVVGLGWCGGDATGEVEEAGAGLIGAPFFEVGDGFARSGSEVGVAVTAFSKKSEDMEVFLALDEAIVLSFGVFEELGGIIGAQSILEIAEGVDVGVGFVDLGELVAGLGFGDSVV